MKNDLGIKETVLVIIFSPAIVVGILIMLIVLGGYDDDRPLTLES